MSSGNMNELSLPEFFQPEGIDKRRCHKCGGVGYKTDGEAKIWCAKCLGLKSEKEIYWESQIRKPKYGAQGSKFTRSKKRRNKNR